MMKLVQCSQKSKLVPDDFISNMPDELVTNILDRLPLQEAVRTGILSSYWRSKWTLLTQLVFDHEFVMYLRGKKKETDYGKIISSLLFHLKGPITKFILYISHDNVLAVEDINNWVLVLSKKGIKELTLMNIAETLELNAHWSCLELEHLELYNCYVRYMPNLCGFPKLLSLDLSEVVFDYFRCGFFLTHCPSLEILKVRYNVPGTIKEAEIAKLQNLRVLSLSLNELYYEDEMNELYYENVTNELYYDNVMTSSTIIRLMCFFPKLQELTLYCWPCKLLADAEKNVQTALPCLETLRLYDVDFSSDIMVSSAAKLICGFPNLKTLVIRAVSDDKLPPIQVDCSRMGQLKLQEVVFKWFRGLESEIHLIKCLLASSHLLKKMSIQLGDLTIGDKVRLIFAEKLLNLHRASPAAELILGLSD